MWASPELEVINFKWSHVKTLSNRGNNCTTAPCLCDDCSAALGYSGWNYCTTHTKMHVSSFPYCVSPCRVWLCWRRFYCRGCWRFNWSNMQLKLLRVWLTVKPFIIMHQTGLLRHKTIQTDDLILWRYIFPRGLYCRILSSFYRLIDRQNVNKIFALPKNTKQKNLNCFLPPGILTVLKQILRVKTHKAPFEKSHSHVKVSLWTLNRKSVGLTVGHGQ